MRLRRITALLSTLLVSCGSDSRSDGQGNACLDCAPSPPLDGLSDSGQLQEHSTGDTPRPDAGALNAGEPLETTSPPADAGPSAVPAIGVCGNGVLEPGEQCDGSDLGYLSCRWFGFGGDALTCSPDCTVNTEACLKVESCSDGIDNDEDSDVDCDDSDCQSVCANACTEPRLLEDGSLVDGQILQHTLGVASSCADNPVGGGQVVFRYEPAFTGVADITLFTDSAGVSVSLRSTCEEAELEAPICSQPLLGTNYSVLQTQVTAANPAFVVVESAERTQPVNFQLVATSRQPLCGDGFIDSGPACDSDDEEDCGDGDFNGGEECDDGNLDNGDGCSEACRFVPTEQEPNQDIANANPNPPNGFIGDSGSATDVDFVSIDVPSAGTLVVETFDLGDAACAQGNLDNQLTIYNQAGDIVAQDDDGGIGFCAAVVTQALPAGTYYVATQPSGAAERFMYRLRLRVL